VGWLEVDSAVARRAQMGNTFFEEGRYEWARSTYMEAVTAIKYGIYIGCDDGPEYVFSYVSSLRHLMLVTSWAAAVS